MNLSFHTLPNRKLDKSLLWRHTFLLSILKTLCFLLIPKFGLSQIEPNFIHDTTYSFIIDKNNLLEDAVREQFFTNNAINLATVEISSYTSGKWFHENSLKFEQFLELKEDIHNLIPVARKLLLFTDQSFVAQYINNPDLSGYAFNPPLSEIKSSFSNIELIIGLLDTKFAQEEILDSPGYSKIRMTFADLKNKFSLILQNTCNRESDCIQIKKTIYESHNIISEFVNLIEKF